LDALLHAVKNARLSAYIPHLQLLDEINLGTVLTGSLHTGLVL
jgi:hypothetical protein